MKNNYRYVVSACLAGLSCRYDGGSNPVPAIVELYRRGLAKAVCPECLGGLSAPRLPCEQRNGRVYCKDGADMTDAFTQGANLALAEALASGCKRAIVKSKSPSCGWGLIYDGSFSKNLVPGNGLWTMKLMANGFSLYDENHLPDSLL